MLGADGQVKAHILLSGERAFVGDSGGLAWGTPAHAEWLNRGFTNTVEMIIRGWEHALAGIAGEGSAVGHAHPLQSERGRAVAILLDRHYTSNVTRGAEVDLDLLRAARQAVTLEAAPAG